MKSTFSLRMPPLGSYEWLGQEDAEKLINGEYANNCHYEDTDRLVANGKAQDKASEREPCPPSLSERPIGMGE